MLYSIPTLLGETDVFADKNGNIALTGKICAYVTSMWYRMFGKYTNTAEFIPLQTMQSLFAHKTNEAEISPCFNMAAPVLVDNTTRDMQICIAMHDVTKK